MPENARFSALFCPTPVAVHYDGDMLRNPSRIDRREQLGLGSVVFTIPAKFSIHSLADKLARMKPIFIRAWVVVLSSAETIASRFIGP